MAELLMVGTVPSLETAVLLFLQQDDPTKATESMVQAVLAAGNNFYEIEAVPACGQAARAP